LASLALHAFFLCSYSDLRHLHSFPTRRSSDLPIPQVDIGSLDAGVSLLIDLFRDNGIKHVPFPLRALPQEIFHRFAAQQGDDFLDRKSTRLNSSHVKISYAVFCLKKKKKELIL